MVKPSLRSQMPKSLRKQHEEITIRKLFASQSRVFHFAFRFTNTREVSRDVRSDRVLSVYSLVKPYIVLMIGAVATHGHMTGQWDKNETRPQPSQRRNAVRGHTLKSLLKRVENLSGVGWDLGVVRYGLTRNLIWSTR